MLYFSLMNDAIREGYSSRLKVDQTVYLAEGPNPYRPYEGLPIVKKAIVREDCTQRQYAVIQRWDELDKPPATTGLYTILSPRSLFTAAEVLRAVHSREEISHLAGVAVDEMLKDPIATGELAIVLSGIAMVRLADDELRHPHNPEY